MTGDRAVLKDVTRFAERLRSLLSQHNGRLSHLTLRDMYESTFGPPPDTEGKDWLSKKLIQYAPHVVNLTGNNWVIWAPAGRPYPDRPHSRMAVSLGVVSSQHHEGNTGSLGFVCQTKPTGGVGWGSTVRDLIDMEEGAGGDTKGAPIINSSSLHTSSTAPHTDSSPSKAYNPHVTQQSATTSNPPLPPLFADLLDLTTEGLGPPPSSSTAAVSNPPPPQREEKPVECDESPYGFLERDPDLLAQLTVREVDEESVVSTDEALQQLLKAGNLMDKPLIPDLPPPHLPPPLIPESLSSPSRPTSNSDEKPFPIRDSSPRGTPLLTDGTTTTDYLKAGLKPDEVLQELYRVKDEGGGVINPASMEPFLSYFGELSSRELERLESQEAKPAAKPLSPTPTKGMLRKKRMMAIRFPGQDSEVDPELQKTLDSLQLPEIRSDSSEDEGDPSVPVQPVSRAELVEELMNRGDFRLQRDGGDDSAGVSGGFGDTGSGGKPLSYPPYY